MRTRMTGRRLEIPEIPDRFAAPEVIKSWSIWSTWSCKKKHADERSELKLLVGDVIYDGMACRTMNDVTAD